VLGGAVPDVVGLEVLVRMELDWGVGIGTYVSRSEIREGEHDGYVP
jgi:hypothetical protein